VQIIAYASVVALTVISAPISGSTQPITTRATERETITVRLSNFDFIPEHLRLKSGVPIRLRLVNESNGGHDFSAPAFFAAGSFPPGVSGPPDGDVAVASHQTVEIAVVPRTPGTYRLECTHFLHSIFGMHGTIEVSL
jgi:uncharacterized cupredoxin-like copper-binding protein